jgi:hypothetical protein
VLRDRDKIFGADFHQQVADLKAKEVLAAPRVALAASLRGACDRLDSPSVWTM